MVVGTCARTKTQNALSLFLLVCFVAKPAPSLQLMSSLSPIGAPHCFDDLTTKKIVI